MTKFRETHYRTVLKVISWRCLITLSHVTNAFIITGNLSLGIKIAGIALITNSFLFWAHERIWNIVQWNRNSHDKFKFDDGHPRSLSKIITWRVLITSSNFIIPFIMTGDWGQAALFTGLATVVNMLLYWSHERIWNWVKWGKQTIEQE